MHTFLHRTFAALALLAATSLPALGAAGPITVLVTNDDGVAAPGIDALVNALASNPNLNVVVYAPLDNQSGTGDQFTTSGTLAISSTTTASGYPAVAVDGFPADAVLYGLLGAGETPDLIVSGINFGQNIAELSQLSGTVGAATWGARNGVPGIAVSQGIPPVPGPGDYSRTADYVQQVVERFRLGGRNRYFERKGGRPPIVLNINAPTCASGSIKGVAVVPLGQSTKVTGYTGTNPVTPVVSTQSPFTVDCTTPLQNPATDLDGFTAGFVTVTPLGINRTITQSLNQFRFLQKLSY